MKHFFFFALFVSFFTLSDLPFTLRNVHASTTWQQTNGPYGDDILAIAIDPSTPQTIYAGTPGGIFKSENGGTSWNNVSAGLTNLSINTLAIDSTAPQTIYAGTGVGIFTSTNGGTSWSPVNNGLTNTYVNVIAIDSSSSQTIYAGTNGGVFKSINSGANWSAVNTDPTGLTVKAIFINPAAPQTIYAGTNGGIFKTINGGTNWNNTNNGLTNTSVSSLASDTSYGTIFAGTSGGVFKSANSGASWSAVNSGLTNTNVHSFAVDSSTTPQTIYAGTAGGVFKTSNNGVNWSGANTTLTSTDVYSLATDPTTPETVFAGTWKGGVFKSITGGVSWSAANVGLTGLSIQSLAIDPTTPQTVFAATYYGGVFKSINGGGSWNAINYGLSTNTNVYSLAIDPSTPLTVYAGTFGGAFKSVNGGTSWSTINTGLTSTYVFSLTIDPSTSLTIYAGTSGGVFKSVNSGASWSAINSGISNLSIRSLIIAPSTSQTIYAGTLGGVFKSVNGGASWSAVNTGLTNLSVRSLVFDPSTSQTIYAGTMGGVFTSIDGGANWSAINTGLTNLSVYSLAIDSFSPLVVYAATWRGGVFKSINAGSSWSEVNTGLANNFAWPLAIDTTVPQTMYTGTSGGVFKILLGAFEFLTVSKSGTGSGDVTSSPVNISCGATCSTTFASGTLVTLTATPADSGSTFTGWSGACSGTGACTVTMDATKNVGAEFTAKINGACSTSLNQTFSTAPVANLCAPGTASSVTASGNLWNWTCSGLYGGTNANCSANIQTYTVMTSITGGNVPLNCTSPVNYGSNSVCTITPVSGFQLTAFTDNTVDKLSFVSADSYTITSLSANHTIAATFSDIQKPVVTSFSLPVTPTTLTVAVLSLTATDNVSVTGYLLTESATAPLVTAIGWSATAQTSYTFTDIFDGIATSKTLYAWAKDAAGYVSNSFAATIIITLPDVTKPVVNAFTIPVTGTTLAVSISSFTAIDNIAVTGYCLSETNSPTGCVWSEPAQTSYTFTGIPDGITTAKTLYAWAKDAAGNVSNSLTATTTITLPDVTKPVITAFSLPASSNTLNVSFTLTATDNTGTIGSYCLIETNSSAGCIWTAQKPTSYNFNTPGSNTLYAFAKDAAGNISTSATDAVTITLPDTAAPIVTAFTIPASSDSLTVIVTTFTATDNIAVNAYLLSESGSQPQSNDANWSASQPTQHLFSSQGTKTIYAFAKDASGNISVPLSAPVTITLADTTAPIVTSFTIPATVVSLTVPVTALVATDAVGVAGYLLKESASVPQDNDSNWTATAPTQYSFTSQGVKTLYVFAKDAAGNISAPLSATVAITLPDTTAPGVSQFTIPATATSLTIPITSFAATDAVGVAGYLLKESSAVPQGNDTNWTANVPTQYFFTSQGLKTLYAFAKDTAGNISAPLSANVTITLADTTAPVVTAFTIPETATNLTVPVSSFSATDADGVNGYYLSETLTAPLLNDSHWTTTPTSSFTFASAGAKTLYAFAKDAAGNISAPASATVTIILLDTTAPSVTVFTMPTTATSLTVPVTTFTASDNTAVTGYILTETATAPQANISGWTSTAPSSYTFSSAGSLTLYAFAKDAAGNISVPVAASISITLPDTTAPTVTAFILPAASSSLTVAVTTFTATDNVAVTGYLLSEGSSTPSPTAQNWASTSQGSYTFSTVGSKTLYAFAKDTAGNISPPASDSVLIVLPAIIGVCGSSDGQVFTVIPSSNLCSTGTATVVSGTGPWSWTCTGTNGGTTAMCNASITIVPVTQFTVIPTTGSGFTITPATPQAVANSATILFTINPTSGFGISSVTGCNGSLDGTSYTTGVITANCTISVTAVARNAGSGGVAQPPTISDALKVLQAVVGTTPLSPTDQIRYDVAPLGSSGNPVGNGAIDAADVILILRRSIGIGSW